MSTFMLKEPIIRDKTVLLGPFTISQLTVRKARVNPIEKLKLGHGFEDSTYTCLTVVLHFTFFVWQETEIYHLNLFKKKKKKQYTEYQNMTTFKKHPEDMLQLIQAESYDINVSFWLLLCSPSLDTDSTSPAAGVPSLTSWK